MRYLQECLYFLLWLISLYFDNIKTIENYAFYNCQNIEKLTIGESINTIGGTAFSACFGLKEVFIKATTPPSVTIDEGQSTFFKNCVIYVPRESLKAYSEDMYWGYYTNYVGYDF